MNDSLSLFDLGLQSSRTAEVQAVWYNGLSEKALNNSGVGERGEGRREEHPFGCPCGIFRSLIAGFSQGLFSCRILTVFASFLIRVRTKFQKGLFLMLNYILSPR